LALFVYKSIEAKFSELDLISDIDIESFGYEKEDFINIKALKKEKVRYFLNASSISKRVLQEIFKEKVLYLHQKDNSFFESKNILQNIDSFIETQEFRSIKEEFAKSYKEYLEIQKEISSLREKEKRSLELKEFLSFEIEKIERINPKEKEYEELLEIKKVLSKKEKILDAISQAEGIFQFEEMVGSALNLLEVDSSFFDDAMSELKEIFANESQKFEELEEVDIENILNRIEELSWLKRKYGSIEEALKVKERKKEELKELENLSFYKDELIEKEKKLLLKIEDLAKEISIFRKKGAEIIQKGINEILPSLKLPSVSIKIKDKPLDITGRDNVEVSLDGVGFNKISSGEYNRLRLGFMSVFSSKKGNRAILILDEIDANISGEESMAVAKILKELSKNYQIFAISHQAQLASLATQHFLVKKEGDESVVLELKDEKRVEEIARIISGDKITKEAREFAKKCLKEID
jgi:DNA repair protein RecN (Recombination protein N)